MAFCSKCGAEVGPGAAFCPKCGQATGGIAPGPIVTSEDLGMAENVAGLLSYVLGWITGLIFLFIDKRPFVRFHAAQSVVVFGGLNIIFVVLASMFGMGWMMGGFFFGTWALGGLILAAVRLVGFVLWILLMVKAYQGQKYRVPVAADLADSIARK
jgi:uncharacterized membrane protein